MSPLITGHLTFLNWHNLTFCNFSVRFYLIVTFHTWCRPNVCVVFSVLQDRKVIIKTMKTYMVKFATVSFISHWKNCGFMTHPGDLFTASESLHVCSAPAAVDRMIQRSTQRALFNPQGTFKFQIILQQLSQERVTWHELFPSDNRSDPEHNWLVCHSPQHTYTPHTKIWRRYRQMYEGGLNELWTSLIC